MNEAFDDDSTILQTLDDLSTEYLARRSVEPAEALKAMLEINRALGGGAELNEVLGRALDALMAVFVSADRGFILIAGSEGKPRLRALRQRTGQAQLPVLSRTILRQVMQEGKAILIKDTAADPRFIAREERGLHVPDGALRAVARATMAGRWAWSSSTGAPARRASRPGTSTCWPPWPCRWAWPSRTTGY